MYVINMVSSLIQKSAIPPTATAIVTPQDRLERVWSSLMMPDNQKLDMAIKYSSDHYHEQLILVS